MLDCGYSGEYDFFVNIEVDSHYIYIALQQISKSATALTLTAASNKEKDIFELLEFYLQRENQDILVDRTAVLVSSFPKTFSVNSNFNAI